MSEGEGEGEEPAQGPREMSLSWRLLNWLSERREQKEARRLKAKERCRRGAGRLRRG